jgi:hypothetical protein
MELKYTNKFFRDLKRLKNDKTLIYTIAKKANNIKAASSIKEIHELIRIRKTQAHYRIKIKISDKLVYRIGVVAIKNTVWFACINNDKKRFYKGFP